MNKFRLLILNVLFVALGGIHGQELDKSKLYGVVTVAFYNVENLYDTIDSPTTDDKDFTPEGAYHFNTPRYLKKLEHLSDVISQLGTETNPQGPAILGLCEIENRDVLEDLIKTPKLKDKNYGIVHFDSPDKRGVDVALLYQKKLFKLINASKHELTFPAEPGFSTRDQLLVSGELDGELMHFIVAHWPSRRGGNESIPKRMKAAKLGKAIIDSLQRIDENAKVIYMGDLNDDPVSESIKTVFKATADPSKTSKEKLFGPMEPLYKKGVGTLAYRDSWNLFDQFIMTKPLTGYTYNTYQFYKTKVYNKPFLSQDDGNFKGYPFRTYVGETYKGGYSDHFAVYMFLVKEIPKK